MRQDMPAIKAPEPRSKFSPDRTTPLVE